MCPKFKQGDAARYASIETGTTYIRDVTDINAMITTPRRDDQEKTIQRTEI